MFENNFRDRVYIVTGAGHRPGIGSSLVQRLMDLGACVLVNSQNFDPDWLTELHQSSRINIVKGDICRSDVQQSLIDGAIARWHRLDGVINNASTGAAEFDEHGLLSRETWKQNFLINCTAVYELCMRSRDHLITTRGSIVNIASRAASKPGSGNNVAYAVSKSALVRLSQELALQFAPEIRVNSVNPGLVASQRIRNIMNDAYSDFEDKWRMSSKLDGPIPADHVVSSVLFCLAVPSITGQNIGISGSAAL